MSASVGSPPSTIRAGADTWISGFADAAAVAGTTGNQHPERSGHGVEPLGVILANDEERATAAREGFAFHVDDLLDAFEIGGQAAAVAVARAECPGLAAGRVRPGVHASHRRVEFFRGECQLVGIELFGACAEPVPLERNDDRGQSLDVRPRVSAGTLQVGDKRLLLADLAACRDKYGAEQRENVWMVGLDQHAHVDQPARTRSHPTAPA